MCVSSPVVLVLCDVMPEVCLDNDVEKFHLAVRVWIMGNGFEVFSAQTGFDSWKNVRRKLGYAINRALCSNSIQDDTNMSIDNYPLAAALCFWYWHEHDHFQNWKRSNSWSHTWMCLKRGSYALGIVKRIADYHSVVLLGLVQEHEADLYRLSKLLSLEFPDMKGLFFQLLAYASHNIRTKEVTSLFRHKLIVPGGCHMFSMGR